MVRWDEWVQCEETAELVIWEEWEEYKRQVKCEGLSFPKNEDHFAGDSQSPLPLTDLPF